MNASAISLAFLLALPAQAPRPASSPPPEPLPTPSYDELVAMPKGPRQRLIERIAGPHLAGLEREHLRRWKEVRGVNLSSDQVAAIEASSDLIVANLMGVAVPQIPKRLEDLKKRGVHLSEQDLRSAVDLGGELISAGQLQAAIAAQFGLEMAKRFLRNACSQSGSVGLFQGNDPGPVKPPALQGAVPAGFAQQAPGATFEVTLSKARGAPSYDGRVDPDSTVVVHAVGRSGGGTTVAFEKTMAVLDCGSAR